MGFPDEGVCPYFIASPSSPFSEWRGEWIVPSANKEGVSSHRRDALFILRRRPL
ncbi:hypothetical protein HMPREF0973_00976 [Prevotella veroralis F0319]|uniref:Uncharacterized protein n=1 Tax=Prevotella veroralis F0319 TaxID=649761 RepID=C9MMZ1_9BACT|nr:hypothetical protein HMPREF0973_00976 [Prevotella veroralis F0319]